MTKGDLGGFVWGQKLRTELHTLGGVQNGRKTLLRAKRVVSSRVCRIGVGFRCERSELLLGWKVGVGRYVGPALGVWWVFVGPTG